MNKFIIKFTFIFIWLLFTKTAYAGPNADAGCSLDADYTTYSYENHISKTDIETNITAYNNNKIYVAIVAQNISNLDTYQVVILYDDNSLQFIGGYEEIPFSGIVNILKSNNGQTIGFQAVQNKPGVICIANSLTGKEINEAPDKSGILGVIGFKIIGESASKITLKDVFFVDSNGNKDRIVNLNDVKVNEE